MTTKKNRIENTEEKKIKIEKHEHKQNDDVHDENDNGENNNKPYAYASEWERVRHFKKYFNSFRRTHSHSSDRSIAPWVIIAMTVNGSTNFSTRLLFFFIFAFHVYVRVCVVCVSFTKASLVVRVVVAYFFFCAVCEWAIFRFIERLIVGCVHCAWVRAFHVFSHRFSFSIKNFCYLVARAATGDYIRMCIEIYLTIRGFCQFDRSLQCLQSSSTQ